MRKMLSLLLIPAAAATAMAAQPASFQYQAVPSGTPNVWNLYFTETSNTSLLSSELGLSDSGVKITRTSGDATTVGALVNNLSGTGFDDSSTAAAFTASTASLNLHTAFSVSRTGGVLPDGNRQVLLGTVTVAPGSTSSQFSVTGWDSPNYSISYNSIANLDRSGTIGASYQWNAAQGSSFTVAAIPEPTSLALLGVGGLVALRRRRA